MRLILSPLAVQKVASIADHVRQHDSNAADRLEAALRDVFAMLGRHPRAGRLISPTVRRFVVPRYPYVVLYRADEAKGQLTIATVRQARQRPVSG